MNLLYSRILNAKRKSFFGSKSIFDAYKPALDIVDVEAMIGASLPESLHRWLAVAGYGDINESLSFRSEWFRTIDRGELESHVIFAQDILGNFYSFSPLDGSIHFVSRSSPEFAFLASDFRAFLEEFERRDFEIVGWTDGLVLQSYNWDP